MSSVDVGDTVTLTFTTTTGATVVVSWINPVGEAVLSNVAVPETPAGTGAFPHTFAPTSDGVWEARFTASDAATAVERFYVRARALTGLPPLATIDEVGELYGTMTPDEESLTGALLRRASSMLRDRFPNLAQRIAAGTLGADAPGQAVINMVLRVLRNPEGVRSKTVGPFSTAYDTSVALGLLVISETEDDVMAPPADNGGAQRAATIMVRAGLAYPGCRRRPGHGWR